MANRLQARLNDLVDRTRAEARALGQAATEGSLSLQAFARDLADLLEDRHTEAVMIGRHAAGDLDPEEEDDRLFALQVVDEEVEHLIDLRWEMAADGADRSRLADRAAHYAERLTGTANDAMSLSLGDVVRWRWVLTPGAAHCEDCLAFAAGGPYVYDELPTVPGGNDCRCLFNCKCSLLSEDGRREGFIRTP